MKKWCLSFILGLLSMMDCFAVELMPAVVKINPTGFGDVMISGQTNSFIVQVPVGIEGSDEKGSPIDVKGLNLEVWLLKGDGTTIPQVHKPFHVSFATSGPGTDYVVYEFAKVPANALSGIVVRAKGKLCCHQLGDGTAEK
ncbi:MAG: hypothetical protein JWM68_122 [Verrucomicrobiales bacterium]|nr:hypothetical protein [Verrucomicrobiales bacterium]